MTQSFFYTPRQGRPSVAALIGCALIPTACFGPSSGTTGTEGVEVYCQNDPYQGEDDGVDESAGEGDEGGGGGGGDGGNYWWVQCPGPGYDCESDDVVCYNQGGYEMAFCKRYSFADVSSTFPGVPICVGEDIPAPVDIDADWVNGGYPSIESEIRDACSAKCLTANVVNENTWSTQQPELEPRCDADNWATPHTGNWEANDTPNCRAFVRSNIADPYGSAVDWSQAGGTEIPLSLGCDLTDECADQFYPHVRAHVVAAGSAEVIEPESRSARYLGVDDGDGELAIDMPGTGAGIDDAEPLHGFAEYSTSDCGQAVCPFFLANLGAYNNRDAWDIEIETGMGRLNKTITNVQIDLLQSTLGMHNVSLGKVAFAPGALRLQVEATVSSCAGCSTFGNGTQTVLLENQEYVFADYDAGSLTVVHTFPVQSGSATLRIGVDVSEYPPQAAHDLGTTESCDHTDGLVLNSSRSLSTDPDDDVVEEVWWVDGLPCVHGCVVPLGSHVVAIEARDSRGAVDRSADASVHVGVGTACRSLSAG